MIKPANQNEVMDIYMLLADKIEYDKFICGDETLSTLEKISNVDFLYVTKTCTAEAWLEYIRGNRNLFR